MKKIKDFMIYIITMCSFFGLPAWFVIKCLDFNTAEHVALVTQTYKINKCYIYANLGASYQIVKILDKTDTKFIIKTNNVYNTIIGVSFVHFPKKVEEIDCKFMEEK